MRTYRSEVQETGEGGDPEGLGENRVTTIELEEAALAASMSELRVTNRPRNHQPTNSSIET